MTAGAPSVSAHPIPVDDADLDAILSVDVDGWKSAVPQIRDHFARFGDKLPAELTMLNDLSVFTERWRK